ncbi:MAG: hypothetical protein IKU98_03785, partial [Bacteroidaceae bacterium]|nr:hypothetical protein [Bacteroidaceae bacterium]
HSAWPLRSLPKRMRTSVLRASLGLIKRNSVPPRSRIQEFKVQVSSFRFYVSKFQVSRFKVQQTTVIAIAIVIVIAIAIVIVIVKAIVNS